MSFTQFFKKPPEINKNTDVHAHTRANTQTIQLKRQIGKDFQLVKWYDISDTYFTYLLCLICILICGEKISFSLLLFSAIHYPDKNHT